MPKDGNKTKLKILEETLSLVLDNGFAGTSIDHILARTNITKGAFFYHFKNKADLAHKLMEHFARKDMETLEEVLAETEQYQSEPVKRLLEFVQWFIDEMSGLDAPYPGCLYASYVYEPEQFGPEIKNIVADSTLAWRNALVDLMKATGKPDNGIDFESLADHFNVIMEGAFIISKALNDPKIIMKQLVHYKNYLEQIF